MTNLKKALIIGSLTAGALLAIKGKRPAALVASTAGLAMLAAEYPEKFEELWEEAPEYVTRGVQIFSTLSKIVERFAEEASRRGLREAWEEAREEYAH
jgi:hypothetical protein